VDGVRLAVAGSGAVAVASSMNPVIKLEDFSKTYQSGEVQVHAVRGVSLSVMPGEFVAVMGASGSGKSTLMNTVGCLDRPTGGRYSLDGVDVTQLDRSELAMLRNEKIGFVFQGFNLLSRTSAVENVELPLLYARGISGREQYKRAMEALEMVGLGERALHHPNQLSGGQQQRVAIARALVNEPKLLLADEPTGNLDTQTSIEIMGLFQDLNRKGMTVVMVTHELDIAHYTKRMLIMRDGRLIKDEAIQNPLSSSEELAKLHAEQSAVALAP
jgi:putative ABC transport system ATP-binding protein